MKLNIKNNNEENTNVSSKIMPMEQENEVMKVEVIDHQNHILKQES